MGMKLQ